MFNLRRPAASAPVKSFLVQAGIRSDRKPSTRKAVLIRHLLSRFQADDSGDEENNVRRTLFLCAAAAIPPVFVAVMLYPAYHPLTLIPTHRPYLSQVGDEYLYVLYSFLAMGIACIALWEAIFPDLLDVFALTLLPLSPALLLRCRATALVLFFGAILLCIAGPGSILLPAIVEGPSVARHLVAHSFAVFAAGIFSCAALVALQAGLEIAVGARLSKRLTPPLQSLVLLALFGLLGLTPGLLRHLQQPAFLSTSLARNLPTFWFLGIYEQLRGGAQDFTAWRSLALRGWFATAFAAVAAGLSFPIAYNRRSSFLVQSGNAAVGRVSFPAWCIRVLHRFLLRTPASRATFHLVAQTSFRAPKARSTLTVYVGMGLALILGFAAHDLSLDTAIMAGAIVAGLHAVVRKRFMPRSAWLFQVLPSTENSHVEGTLRIAACWGTLGSFVVLLVYAVTCWPTSSYAWHAQIVALATALCLPLLLATMLFFTFAVYPFTTEPETSPERFVLLLLACLVVMPGSLFLFHRATAAAERTISGSVLCFICLLGLTLATHRVRSRRQAFKEL